MLDVVPQYSGSFKVVCKHFLFTKVILEVLPAFLDEQPIVVVFKKVDQGEAGILFHGVLHKILLSPDLGIFSAGDPILIAVFIKSVDEIQVFPLILFEIPDEVQLKLIQFIINIRPHIPDVFLSLPLRKNDEWLSRITIRGSRPAAEEECTVVGDEGCTRGNPEEFVFGLWEEILARKTSIVT